MLYRDCARPPAPKIERPRVEVSHNTHTHRYIYMYNFISALTCKNASYLAFLYAPDISTCVSRLYWVLFLLYWLILYISFLSHSANTITWILHVLGQSCLHVVSLII